MIDYVKEYGVTDLDFEYIMNNLNRDIIDNMILSEPNVREVLSYYNKIGIKENVAKIIVTRPDLILISRKKLEESSSVRPNVNSFNEGKSIHYELKN